MINVFPEESDFNDSPLNATTPRPGADLGGS